MGQRQPNHANANANTVIVMTNPSHRHNRRGFTLLEAVIAIALLMLVCASAMQLLLYTAERASRMTMRQELFENARGAIEFIAASARMADIVSITHNADGTFSGLVLIGPDPNGDPRPYDFSYDAPRNRVVFDRNELASYIVRMGVEIRGERLLLYLETVESMNGRTVGPITLRKAVDIQYKEIVWQ